MGREFGLTGCPRPVRRVDRRDPALREPVGVEVDRLAAIALAGHVQGEPRHGVAARLVWRDHVVGARADQLLLGRLLGRAGDDLDVGPERPRGDREEDVLIIRRWFFFSDGDL